jgi:hypothetical protein
MSSETTGYLLPEVIDPTARRYVCIGIPDEPMHILAFLGQLDMLGYWWTWERDPLKRGTQVARVWREVTEQVRDSLDNTLGCGENGMELRQNPDDTCQLQWRANPDDEWHLAFDYGMCVPSWANPVLEDAAENTPPSPYAPTTTFVYTSGDTPTKADERAAALCAASVAVVNNALDAFIEARNSRLVVPTIVSIAAGLALFILPLVGASIWMLIGIAIAKGALDVWKAYDTLITDAIASDLERRDKMACHLYSTLATRPVNLTSFTTAFAVPSCFTGDDDLVYQFLNDLLQNSPTQQDIYAGFLQVLGGSTQAIGAGAEPDICPCSDDTWNYAFEGEELHMYFEPHDPTKTEWDEANQVWRSISTVGDCTPYCAGAVIKKSFFIPSDTTITSFQIYYDRPSGGVHQVIMDDGAGFSSVTSSVPPYIYPIGGFVGYSASGGVRDYVMGVINNNYSNAITISKVCFQGSGRRLFGSCDTC